MTTMPQSSLGRVTTRRRRPDTGGIRAILVLAGISLLLILAVYSPSPASEAAAACGGCMLQAVAGPRAHGGGGKIIDLRARYSAATATSGVARGRSAVSSVAPFARHPAHVAASLVLANGMCHLGRTALHHGLNSLERRLLLRAAEGEADGRSNDPTAADDDAAEANDSKPSDSDEAVGGGEVKDPMSSSMVASIQFYKNFISPLLPPACRFLPTCSQYGVRAIQEFGPTKGAILTAWRLLRCSPIGGKGYDPPRWPPVPYNYGSY